MDAVQVSLRGLSRWQATALLGILMLGIGIRMLFLSLPIALDEATTYNSYASQPLTIALSDYSAPNNHLFHTLLVHLVTQFGNDEWIIRLPAFFAGLSLIPVTFQVGKRLFNTEAGLLAAAFVAASSPLIEYSTSARGYTLLTLFSLLLILVASNLIERESRWLWGLFAVFGALGFYTVPVMLYPFSGTVVWLGLSLVIKGEERRLFSLFAAATIAVTLTIILYLPVFFRSGAAAVIDNVFVQSREWSEYAPELLETMTNTWQLSNRDLPAFLQLLLLIGLVLSMVFHQHVSKRRVPLLAVLLTVSAALVLVQRVAPFARVWLWLLPMYFITASAGIILIVQRASPHPRIIPIAAVLLCTAIGINVVTVRSGQPFTDGVIEPDAENIALFLQANYSPDANYVVVPVSDPLIYYFKQLGLPSYHLGGDLPRVNSDRLLVVVLEPDYTLDSMLSLMGDYGLNSEPYSSRVQIAQFRTASLWELTP